MPADLEDRLTQGLGDLARNVPVPANWPELGEPMIRLDRPSPRRPWLVTGLVTAAAVIIVVAVGVFAVSRSSRPRGTTSLRVASEPGGAPAASAPSPTVSAPGVPTGRWDPDGPRLSEAQLAELITPATTQDGRITWHLSDELSQRELGSVGPLPFAVEVTKLSIAKVQLGKVNLAKFTGPVGKALPQIQFYVDNLPPQPNRNVNQQVWLVAVEGDFLTSSSKCPGSASNPLGSTPGCDRFAGMFVTAIPADEHDTRPTRFAFGPIAGMKVDFSAFDQVGHWTPN